MKFFSIIIPTIGRKDELDRLLQSIVNQKYKNLEIIIVDQNKNNLIDDLVEKYENIFKIYHEKVKFKGAAKARNYGFKKSSGEIILFSDDDSTLAPNVLKYVDDFLEKREEIQAVFGRVQDKESNKDILHFKKKDSKVKLCNLYQTTIETTMFIRRKKFEEIGMYDENLGIGTYFGAEEGADLVARLLYKKTNMMFIAKTFFYHPNKRQYDLLDRAYSYNLGFGALVCKHIKEYKKIYPMFFYLILKILKNIFEILMGIVTFNKLRIDYNYISLKGKVRGIVEKRKDYANNENCNCA